MKNCVIFINDLVYKKNSWNFLFSFTYPNILSHIYTRQGKIILVGKYVFKRLIAGEKKIKLINKNVKKIKRVLFSTIFTYFFLET